MHDVRSHCQNFGQKFSQTSELIGSHQHRESGRLEYIKLVLWPFEKYQIIPQFKFTSLIKVIKLTL